MGKDIAGWRAGSTAKAEFASDRERVEFLFQLYEKLTAPMMALANAKPKRTRKIIHE